MNDHTHTVAANPTEPTITFEEMRQLGVLSADGQVLPAGLGQRSVTIWIWNTGGTSRTSDWARRIGGPSTSTRPARPS